MKLVNTVVFDVDGTLVDTFSNCLAVERLFRQRYPGRPVPHEWFLRIHSQSRRETCAMLEIPEEEWRLFMEDVFRSCGPYVNTQPLFDGVAATVRALRDAGYRLGLNTSRDATTLNKVLAVHKNNLFCHFDPCCFVTADRVAHPKPAPDSLWYIMEHCALAPEQLLYIGDNAVDQACARSAGVRFAWAAWGWNAHTRPADTHAEPLLQHPGELRNLLQKATG